METYTRWTKPTFLSIKTVKGNDFRKQFIRDGKRVRFCRIYRGNITDISKKDIRRLARRGGIKRMSSSEAFYDNVRSALYQFLDETIADASHYSNHARRQTITALDVVHALKRRGITLYGYGG